MPIRFRCVYCNQLLGIARRKAGNIVRCTNCDGQLIVPEPGAHQAAAQLAAGGQINRLERTRPGDVGLFERNDFDDLLQPYHNPPAPSAPAPSASEPTSAKWAAPPISGKQIQISMSSTRMTLLVLAGVLAVGGSFLLGLLIGLSMASGN